jgi:hypothetical protein
MIGVHNKFVKYSRIEPLTGDAGYLRATLDGKITF